jgi:hypothetical protein
MKGDNCWRRSNCFLRSRTRWPTKFLSPSTAFVAEGGWEFEPFNPTRQTAMVHGLDIDELSGNRGLLIFPQFRALQRLRWFEFTPKTKIIIQAFEELPAKAYGRLRDKVDVESTGRIFRKLAGYLYSEIPQVLPNSPREREELHAWGEQALNAFAQEVCALSSYVVSPASKVEEKPNRVVRIWSALTLLFVHQSVLIRFLAWYACTETIVLISTRLAFYLVPTLILDSTIVVAIITVPLIAAATAAAVAPK